MSQGNPVPRVKSGVPWWLWAVVGIITLAVVVGTLISAVPEDPQQIFTEAFDAAQNRDPSKLEAAIATLQRYPEFETQATLLQGMQAAFTNRDPKAIELFAKVTQPNDLHASALIYSALSHQRMAKLDKAIELLREADRVDPTNLKARTSLISLYQAVGAVGLVRQEAPQLLEDDPDNQNVTIMLANAHFEAMDYKQAAELYGTLVATAGQRASVSPDVITKYAQCLVATDDFEKLIAFYDEDPMGIPDDYSVWRLLIEKGDLQTLLQAMTGSLSGSAESPIVLKTNARVAISENKPDAAYSLLSQVLATRPRDIETLELLKEVTLALGKTDEADICQQNLDQLKDMRQQYITLINDSTDNVSDTQVRLQLGELGYSFGEYSKAQAWFQKALLIDPSLQGQVDEKMKVLYDEIGMLVPLSDTDSQDTPDTADTPDESKEATESTPDSGDTPKADSPETATPDASTDAAPADPKPADPAPPADSDNPM